MEIEELKNKIRDEFKNIDQDTYKETYLKVRENTYHFVDKPTKLIKKRATQIRELCLQYTWDDLFFKINMEEEYHIKNESFFKEIWSHTLYIESFIINKNYKFINNITSDFLERLFIRIILIKKGWTLHSIDSMLKVYYNIEYEKKSLIFFHTLIATLFQIQKKIGKGRNKIPEEIKKILKKKKNEKNSHNMRNIYDIHNLVKQLTKNDLNSLIKTSKNSKVVRILDEIKNKIYSENKI